MHDCMKCRLLTMSDQIKKSTNLSFQFLSVFISFFFSVFNFYHLRNGLVKEADESKDWPRGYKTFLCSFQLSMKFSLLINVKIPIKVGVFFSILLAEKFSCSSMFSKEEFAIVSNLRYIIRTNFILS